MADTLANASSFPPDWSLNSLQSRIDYDRKARSAVAAIGKLSRKEILAGNPLETLDPTTHSVAWIVALLAHASNPTQLPTKPQDVPDAFRPQGELWGKTAVLLNCFSPVQVRYAGAEWRKLVEYFERSSTLMSAPASAVLPIRNAILRLDPTAGTFTSTHILFLRLCLEARTYTRALPILQSTIHSFPMKTAKGVEAGLPSAAHRDSSGYITLRSGLSDRIQVSHVQEYFLLGGMVYLGLKRYKEALMFFEYVISSPTSGIVSALMIEAYKKWILVGCLVTGKMPSHPKSLSGTVQRSLAAVSKPYEGVADAFGHGNRPKLMAEIDVGQNWWKQDGNDGLVQLLVQHLPRFYVLNLQKTYAAMPLSQVATYLGDTVDVIKPYLEQLIEQGYLNATIGSAGAAADAEVLRFFPAGVDGPQGKAEAELHRDLLDQTQRTNSLVEYVKTADHRASLSKEYIDFLKAKSRKGDAGLEDAMDTSWDAMDQPDEDMMSDLR